MSPTPSLHALAVIPEGAVGTGRLTPPTPSRPEAQIAWVATLPDYRGRGVGTAVMHALLAAADEAGMATVLLSAQVHALGFYRRFGFVPYGNRFTVRGIEHQAMIRWRPR
jgi:predicted GNAT family N-acyltransferase